jgi:uncharacterized RDD family membrane protein YckC
MDANQTDNGYYIVEQGQKKGPLNVSTLETMRTAGTLSDTTLVWRDGMTDWQPARAVLPTLFSEDTIVSYVVAGPGQRMLSGIIDIFVVQLLIILLALVTAGFGLLVELGYPLANALYAGVMVSNTWRGTVGKTVLGLKVIDAGGGVVSAGQAWGRAFASILSWFPLFGIGNLFVFFTPRHQALHDMMAGTLVVKATQQNERQLV